MTQTIFATTTPIKAEIRPLYEASQSVYSVTQASTDDLDQALHQWTLLLQSQQSDTRNLIEVLKESLEKIEKSRHKNVWG